MKLHLVVISLLSLALFACKPKETVSPTAASVAASSGVASEPSPIVSEILNSPQEQDILATSRQAMQSVSASDVAAVTASAASEVVAASQTVAANPADDVKLPAVCEAYYQRVDRCFAKNKDSEALRTLNQDARLELAEDNPTDKTCVALNKSFDAVAHNLACE